MMLLFGRKAGRQRGIDAEATRLREAFRAPQMRHLPLVEQAMGRQALALLRQLDAACAAADDLEQATIESFNQHPDAGTITSFPGLGLLTSAWVLAETGDDRSRFQDAKGLKAYAGAAPITRASGKTRAVRHRRVKNQRLAAAGQTYDITGPAAISFAELAQAFTAARRTPVGYADQDVNQALALARASGMPEWQAQGWVSALHQVSTGELDLVSDTVRALTGRRPASLAEFLGQPSSPDAT